MPKRESPLSGLQDYLPQGSLDRVVAYLQHYKVHLTVAKERKSILGDYRHQTQYQNHRISVNGNLNKYSFLITLLHELAHLLAFENFGHRIEPHGREWKQVFSQMLAEFIQAGLFPPDIKNTLLLSMNNPAASSCADENLLRVLRLYDQKKEGLVFVESLPPHSVFRTHDGRIFKRGDKLRKRFRCEELTTKRVYLFSAVYEVEHIVPSIH